MQTTANYNLKKPENTDPVDIQDLNDNADILDEEIKKKVNASGGDISNTTIKTLDNITTEFPVPEAGEKPGTFLAKVRKFIQDFNNFKTGIITVGKLANNGSTTAAGMALDARYGKTLYDYYTQLNSNLNGINSSMDVMSGIVQDHTTELYNLSTNKISWISGSNYNPDVNNLKESGFYYYNTNSVSNLPSYEADNAFYILVFSYNDLSTIQLYMGFKALNTIGVYARGNWGGTWRSWIKLG